jgi:hypothetical protein
MEQPANVKTILANARDYLFVRPTALLDAQNHVWWEARGGMHGGTAILRKFEVPYRTADPAGDTNFTLLTSEDYKPLAKLMRDLTPFVGDPVCIRVDAYPRNTHAIVVPSLDEALDRYRAGSLHYTGKLGGVYFESNAPELRTGIVDVHFRYSSLDELSETTLSAVEDILRERT